ncbi:hypothetical protein HK096_008580 [Nowakowskiella sp. JEL0078]|nr:hypothetical protein HK096_008580 [Nowakowskiella sp. JEL0078]
MDDIVLSSENTIPNFLEIKVEHSGVFGLRKSYPCAIGHSVHLGMYQIHADFKDVAFFIRKYNFPQWEDFGVLGMKVSGQGISVIIDVGIDHYSSGRTLMPTVKCHIDNFQLTLSETKKPAFVYDAILTTLNEVIKEKLAHSLQMMILEKIKNLDLVLNDLKKSKILSKNSVKSRFRYLKQEPRRAIREMIASVSSLDDTKMNDKIDLTGKGKGKKEETKPDIATESDNVDTNIDSKNYWMSNVFSI